jgi:cholesterol 7-dehydrogenase
LNILRLRRSSSPDSTSFDEARLRTYPPPFPSGWYKVADADELDRGRILRIECASEHIVLFRDGAGAASALDARCPHLGADLSAGVMKDGCLECPFHQWCFRGDGTVSHIPYQARVPPSLHARSWPVRELWGMIFLYHAHLAEDRDKPPHYELPALDEITGGSFVYRGQHDCGVTRMHLLEFAENGPDAAHFTPLHGRMTVPWTQVRIPFIEIDHRAEWHTDPEQRHVAHFHNLASLKFLGKAIPRSGATAHVTFIGPGALGILRFTLPNVGEILLLETHTPIAPMRVKVELRWFAEPRVPRPLVSYVVGNWVSQLMGDVRIWERKSYNAKPMVIENDGPLHRFRQWYRQFYEPAQAP